MTYFLQLSKCVVLWDFCLCDPLFSLPIATMLSHILDLDSVQLRHRELRPGTDGY